MSAIQDAFMAVIVPEYYDPERGYQLCTIWNNLQGFYPSTRFFCGHDLDLAIEYVNELNLSNGFTPKQVTEAFEQASGLAFLKFYKV